MAVSSSPPPVVAAVGAHDPLGGAGLAADLTTFASLGVHGVVAVTALTAQHLASVDTVEPTPPDLVGAQLDGIVADFTVAAVKTGLLGSAEIVEIVVARIDAGTLPAPVVDPVLVDGRGVRFVPEEVEAAYRTSLIPRARVLTPNVHEASLLLGRRLDCVDDVVAVADELAGLGAQTVAVTGGSFLDGPAVDVVIDGSGAVELLEGPRFSSVHVRGSGCTFAAATAAMLAHGDAPTEALRTAKRFVSDRIAASSAWQLGDGVIGPVAHWF